MPIWKLVIEYEGTRFRGWQEQKNARTVAGEIRQSAESYFGRRVELSGAGRTDAGVHALEQVARLRVDKNSDELELMHALNDRLPPDINVLKAEKAHDRFDPRRDAVTRYYLYQVSMRRSAFAKRFVWWVKDRLDIDSMREAFGHITGRRDFQMFCERREDERSTIVDVSYSAVEVLDNLILFRIGASHFLWKMVRRLVGTVVEVGRGNLGREDFRLMIDKGSISRKGRDYSIAAHTAPPSGLFLERVYYGRGLDPGPIRAAFSIGKSR